MVKQNSIGVGGSRRSSIEVLLAENVTALGRQGDIVKVKPGFARNFLLPQGLATIATDHNKRMVQKHKERTEAAIASQVKGYRKQADAISKYSVTLEANANEEGQLYGSIVAANIAEALKAASFDVSPEHILLEGPLKELGMYTIKVSLHEKVQTEVKVWVVPTATE